MMFLKLCLIAFIIFIAIDALWLGLISPKFYKKNLSHLMNEKPNFIAAIIFYVIYIVAMVFLVIKPTVLDGTTLDAFLNGAVFGLVAYATYDLTNLATLKKWPLNVTIVDLIWGTLLSSFIVGMTFIIYGWIF